MEIKQIAIIGMGAVGTVYGNRLHQTYGSNFAVIAGGKRAEKIKNNGITFNNQPFFPRVISNCEGQKIDLLIVSVKNYQLDDAIEDMRPFVGEETAILPLLNGVTARDRLAEAFPEAKVFYGLCVQIDAERRPDGAVVNTTDGLIQFGYADNTIPAPEVSAVQDILQNAGIVAQVCPDMMRAIWKKWMLNVGCNQVSAVTRAPYGKITNIESNRILFHEAMMEVVALAKAAHVDLTHKDVLEFETMIDNFSPFGKTSMLQDVEGKRKTEVDYFSGTVIEFGKKLNVPTPVNHVLYYIIKSIEQLYEL